jgi:hypothetical protein
MEDFSLAFCFLRCESVDTSTFHLLFRRARQDTSAGTRLRLLLSTEFPYVVYLVSLVLNFVIGVTHSIVSAFSYAYSSNLYKSPPQTTCPPLWSISLVTSTSPGLDSSKSIKFEHTVDKPAFDRVVIQKRRRIVRLVVQVQRGLEPKRTKGSDTPSRRSPSTTCRHVRSDA